MAARLNRLDTERVLKRIKTSQLINRLQDNALGELKNPKGEPIFMTEGQIASARFLIERTIARAEAPKDLNVKGSLTLQVVTGVPQSG